jgi:hypothetical protein
MRRLVQKALAMSNVPEDIQTLRDIVDALKWSGETPHNRARAELANKLIDALVAELQRLQDAERECNARHTRPLDEALAEIDAEEAVIP